MYILDLLLKYLKSMSRTFIPRGSQLISKEEKEKMKKKSRQKKIIRRKQKKKTFAIISENNWM